MPPAARAGPVNFVLLAGVLFRPAAAAAAASAAAAAASAAACACAALAVALRASLVACRAFSFSLATFEIDDLGISSRDY